MSSGHARRRRQAPRLTIDRIRTAAPKPAAAVLPGSHKPSEYENVRPRPPDPPSDGSDAAHTPCPPGTPWQARGELRFLDHGPAQGFSPARAHTFSRLSNTVHLSKNTRVTAPSGYPDEAGDCNSPRRHVKHAFRKPLRPASYRLRPRRRKRNPVAFHRPATPCARGFRHPRQGGRRQNQPVHATVGTSSIPPARAKSIHPKILHKKELRTFLQTR